ncbi:cystatin-like 1 [Tachyglossus aculeatus]|uniref:cystatin-like 1 n=1 Tax=Tachyglossus aculeatus TaxID=9261 RepID=UPI0018F72D77|nr:cystatin-like 1 [Tachyglossus aculeatus]
MMSPWGWIIFHYLITSGDLTRAPNGLCSRSQNLVVKPGFPKVIKTNDPGVLKAARIGVEKFNNCTNDIFLFKESRVNKAMVQIVKGLKYMLDVEIGRTVCRKSNYTSLDNCDFQTNQPLKQMFKCYFEVWIVAWLQKAEVLLLHCQ